MTSILQWQESGQFFQFRSHQIFTRCGGKAGGPVLLLIHGFPTCSWDWHSIWDQLCEHFQLITLDLLGFGLSDKPLPHRYSIHEQADIIEALLDQQGVSNYHILAHDYGDTVAQELMARASKRSQIASVIMTNGGLFPETHHPVLIQKLLLSPLGGLVAALTSFRKFKQNFDRICYQSIPEEQLRAYWELLLRGNGRALLPELIQYMPERIQHRSRWVSALQNFERPLCLIDGVEDPISGRHMVERFRELLPTVSVYELEKVGHYPQLEAPIQLLNGAFDFWSSHAVD